MRGLLGIRKLGVPIPTLTPVGFVVLTKSHLTSLALQIPPL